MICNGFASLGPAIARATSTYELAGNHKVGLGEAPAALSKNIATASSLDSYDSAVEDAQRREPKRVKETFVTPKKPLPADAAEAISEPKPCPRPSKAAKLNAPPADVGCPKPTTDRSPKPTADRSPKPTTDRSPKPTGVRSPKPTTGPTRLNSQDSSPGPSASDVAPPGPAIARKRSKSPSYWRTQLEVHKGLHAWCLMIGPNRF